MAIAFKITRPGSRFCLNARQTAGGLPKNAKILRGLFKCNQRRIAAGDVGKLHQSLSAKLLRLDQLRVEFGQQGFQAWPNIKPAFGGAVTILQGATENQIALKKQKYC